MKNTTTFLNLDRKRKGFEPRAYFKVYIATKSYKIYIYGYGASWSKKLRILSLIDNSVNGKITIST